MNRAALAKSAAFSAAPGDASSEWQSLARELDAWAAEGKAATFWWRDDDAVADTPALRRLLDLARTHDIPVALAVIPAKAQRDLFDLVESRTQASLLQHGYAHANHAAPGAKKCELGAERPRAVVLDEIAQGREVLRAMSQGRALPVLVPPWNRIDAGLMRELPGLGITALSTAKPRSMRRAAAGLVHANTHVDPIAWHDQKRFAGVETVLRSAVSHLNARRTNQADADEPTGLLTHHLVQDEACWRFLDDFLVFSRRHAAVKWLAAGQVFDLAPWP